MCLLPAPRPALTKREVLLENALPQLLSPALAQTPRSLNKIIVFVALPRDSLIERIPHSRRGVTQIVSVVLYCSYEIQHEWSALQVAALIRRWRNSRARGGVAPGVELLSSRWVSLVSQGNCVAKDLSFLQAAPEGPDT